MTTFRSGLAVFAAIAVGLISAACSAGATPSAASFAGTSWKLSDMGGESPDTSTPVTLNFDASYAVSGVSGCNNYTGTATVSGSSITFSPLATTRKACPEPAMTLEQQYLAALQSTKTWRMDGTSLVLEGGVAALTFDPA